MKKFFLVTLLVFCLGIFASPVFIQSALKSSEIPNKISSELSSETYELSIIDSRVLPISAESNHAPINLDSETALDTFCAGNGTDGTLSNPYVLENFTIDAIGSDFGIRLSNIEKFVIIKNCSIFNSEIEASLRLDSCANITIYNCTIDEGFSGISLISSSNCNITNNHIFGENENCILINESSNCIISDNLIESNIDGYGIYLYNSSSCLLSYNNGSNIEFGAFRLTNCSNCIIEKNNATDNFQRGFTFSYLTNCTIKNNYAFKTCLFDGMRLLRSSNCTITGNTFINNSGWFGTGLDIYCSSNCNFTENTFENDGLTFSNSTDIIIDTTNLANGKPIHFYANQNELTIDESYGPIGQLLLINVNDSVITNVEISQIGWGIYLENCSNNLLDNNIINECNTVGIFLRNSPDCVLNDNLFTDSESYGIGTIYTINCRISNNIIHNLENFGISIHRSSNCNITNNTVMNDEGYGGGIGFQESNNNFITGNNVSHLTAGICLYYSSKNNLISDNLVSFNSYEGISLYESSTNLITENVVSNNGMNGIYFDEESNYNTVSYNTIQDNQENDILDEGEGNIFLNNYFGGDDLQPEASFSASAVEIELGDIVSFTDTSTGGNLPLTYQWSFGDGTGNSTEQNPSHLYTTTGTFNVILTVIDNDGDVSVFTMDITVVVELDPGLSDDPKDGIPGFSLSLILLFGLIGTLITIFQYFNRKGKKEIM